MGIFNRYLTNIRSKPTEFKLFSCPRNKSTIALYNKDLQVVSSNLINKETSEAITQFLKSSKAEGTPYEKRMYFDGNRSGYDSIALVCTGELSGLDHSSISEVIRRSAATGLKLLKQYKYKDVVFGLDAHQRAFSEGVTLAQYEYKEGYDHSRDSLNFEETTDQTVQGNIFGKAQNLARYLMETPSNILTPTEFSQISQKLFSSKEVVVKAKDEAWIKEQGMHAFLAVAKGSNEQPRFVEIFYNGNKDSKNTDLCFIGKGVTFDSGGISIKPSSNMDAMKADMGGAATALSSMWAISQLQPKINCVCVIPLCENMPSGKAVKPGDVITCYNKKRVEVLNTDAEGRLILADSIAYATRKYNPETLITVATLTGAMMVALGDAYTGVFSTSNDLWDSLYKAGLETNEKLWRMPFDKTYLMNMRPKIKNIAEFSNIGLSRSGGGSCEAATFLREFVYQKKPEIEKETYDLNNCNHLKPNYAHLDMAGVMESRSNEGYNTLGMSGRPTRALIQYALTLQKK